MSRPLIIEVGLNEGTSREENPTVPFSPQEIADDILACAEAGASIVHFHARDPQTGANRLNDTDLYRDAIGRVRAVGCDIHLYPTYPPYETDLSLRFQHVRALTEEAQLGVRMAPLDMGSFNLIQFMDGRFAETTFMPLDASVYVNPFLHLKEMLEYYRDRGMIPTLAAFEPGHIRAVAGFMRAGMFRGAPILKFFFSDLWLHGVLADRQGLEAYLHMLEASDLLDQVEWMCVPYAVTSPDREHTLLSLAIERGGHVRVGVGDNPLTSNGRSNAELVAEVAGRAKAASRSVATPGDVIAMTAPRA